MLLALVLLNVCHPGRLMPGNGSNLPSRKQRKSGLKTEQELGHHILPMSAAADVQVSKTVCHEAVVRV